MSASTIQFDDSPIADPVYKTPILKVIDRLLGEAAAAPGQKPAIICQLDFVDGRSMQGAFTLDDEPGIGKLGQAAKNGNGMPCVAETFFRLRDVARVIVTRDVTQQVLGVPGNGAGKVWTP